mgnify:CR=1 FL=1
MYPTKNKYAISAAIIIFGLATLLIPIAIVCYGSYQTTIHAPRTMLVWFDAYYTNGTKTKGYVIGNFSSVEEADESIKTCGNFSSISIGPYRIGYFTNER